MNKTYGSVHNIAYRIIFIGRGEYLRGHVLKVKKGEFEN